MPRVDEIRDGSYEFGAARRMWEEKGERKRDKEKELVSDKISDIDVSSPGKRPEFVKG